MRSALAPTLTLALCSSFAVAAASAPDVIRYLSCRADNETTSSIFAIDETTQKVCDRETGVAWFSPPIFDASKIEWNDGWSTKSIYRTGKDKRYERDILILVHVGRCKKVPAPSEQLCKG